MIRRGLEWFGGSVLVYVLVAACSAKGVTDEMTPFRWSGGASVTDHSSGGDSKSMGDGGGSMPMGDGGRVAQSDGGNTIDGGGESGGSLMGDGDGDSGGMMGMIMDPVPDADAAEDGTRIVNLYRTTADGLKTQEGYWDKELEVQCWFQLASDGKTRCIPATPTASIGVYFADDGCTQEVAYMTKGVCVTNAAKSLELVGSCDAPLASKQERYSLGSKVTALYRGSPESCSDATSALESIDAYQVGSLIDPTTYVEGTFVHD